MALRDSPDLRHYGLVNPQYGWMKGPADGPLFDLQASDEPRGTEPWAPSYIA